MGSRGATERQAIEQSQVDGEKKQQPRRGRRSLNSLYSSWGADDALLYFRFAGAAVGFRAQAITPQAIALGKRSDEFWDEAEDRRMRDEGKRKQKLSTLSDAGRALLEHLELDGPPVTATASAARPTHSRQCRTFTRADRMTDAQLDSVRSLRRIKAGMQILAENLDPKASGIVHFMTLREAFLPRRTELKVELEFPQLFEIVLASPDLKLAYEKDSKGTSSLVDWIVKRIERREALRGLSITDGTKETEAPLQAAWEWAMDSALLAIAAYEEVTAEPPEVVQERLRKADEDERRKAERTRAPRVSVVDAFAPAGFGR